MFDLLQFNVVIGLFLIYLFMYGAMKMAKWWFTEGRLAT